MGRELRSIVLSLDEFEAAVGAYYEETKGTVIHPNNIRSLEVSQGPDITCVVRFINPLLDGREEVCLDDQQIAEVIIRFVKGKGHPLPRRGKKSLAWIEKDLALMIELDWF